MRKYKKLTGFNLSLLFLIIAALSSCVKSRDGETSFDGLQPFVLIREGGLANFGTKTQALTFPGTDSVDTIYFRVNYAAKTVAPSDVTVTIAYDENALNSYNSSSGAAAYAKFPDSIYSFTSTKVTIKAGQQFSDLVPLVVYPSKVDPTKNYMLPLTITDGGGTNVSSNFGTIYYHFIGNPIAGAYKWNWHRWDANDSTSVPKRTISFDGASTVFSPDDPNTIEVASGYYIQPRYVITFDNDNGTLSNFAVTLNSDDVKSMNTGGVSVASGPNIIYADPTIGHYKFQWVAFTGSAFRYITDEYYK